MKSSKLCMSLVAVSMLYASAASGKDLSKLPEVKKPSFFEGGCTTKFLADEGKITKNLGKVLWCVDDNLKAKKSKGKAKDKNFVDKLGNREIFDVLNDYKDSEEWAQKVKDLIAKDEGRASELRQAQRDVDDAKERAKGAKKDSKNANKEATNEMLKFAEDAKKAMNDASDFNSKQSEEKTGIVIPDKNEDTTYGSKEVNTKKAVYLRSVKLASERIADKYDLSNFGNLDYLVTEILEKPEEVANHPNFLRALKKALKRYWLTEDVLGKVTEASYDKVVDFAKKARLVLSARMVYDETLDGKKDDAYEKSERARRDLSEAKGKKKELRKTKKPVSDDVQEDGEEAPSSEADDDWRQQEPTSDEDY